MAMPLLAFLNVVAIIFMRVFTESVVKMLLTMVSDRCRFRTSQYDSCMGSVGIVSILCCANCLRAFSTIALML